MLTIQEIKEIEDTEERELGSVWIEHTRRLLADRKKLVEFIRILAIRIDNLEAQL